MKPNKTKALNATNTTEDSNSTQSESTPSEEGPRVVKKTKRRTVPFPLNKIEKQLYGVPALSSEQLKACRERLKAYEKKDEDKAKTDKAKNDFESIIYSMRDWVQEEDNLPFVGGAQKQDGLTQVLREAEDWLENDGSNANLNDYLTRLSDLNSKYQKLKIRKEEYSQRDPAVDDCRKRISTYQDKLDDVSTKKAWITEDHKKDLYEKLNETLAWLEAQVDRQKTLPLDEDPAFRVSEIDVRLKRIESMWQRLNNLQKPKDATKDKKKKKLPKNIKIENMKFDGSGDFNLEDLINVQGGDEGEEEEETTQQQQQEPEFTQE